MGGITVATELHTLKQEKLVLRRRLGAAQRPVQASRPPVSANSVASHLVQGAKTPKDKNHKNTDRDE